MIRNTRIPAKDCTCEQCSHNWCSIAKKIPEACPNPVCRSREWNGIKQRIVKPSVRIELPRPKRVRIVDDEF